MKEKLSIADIQKMVHENSLDKGFWEGLEELTVDGIGMKLALIHSEVSEALEDVRVNKLKTYIQDNGKPCGFSSELADVVIRIFDLAEKMGINMEEEILLKHKFNVTRPYRHGGKLA